MLYTYLIDILGFIVFLFLFWRKLKEDYIASQIFTSGLFILIGIVLGAALAKKIMPLWWFWFCLAGALMALTLAIFKFKLRFYEVFEAEVIAFTPWLGLVFLGDSIKNLSWFSFSEFILVVLAICLYLYVSNQYKDFGWYKSGRIGVAGLVSVGGFFLTRSVIASIFPFMLSFVGKTDCLISAAVSFMIFLMVFNLSKSV